MLDSVVAAIGTSEIERANLRLVIEQLSTSMCNCIAAYGLAVDAPRVGTEPCGSTDDHIATVLAFLGDDVDGVVALGAPSGLVAHCLPRGHKLGVGAGDIEDWLAELGNQIVGRVKNELVAFGVASRMTRPIRTAFHELSAPVTECERTVWVQAPTAAGTFWAALQLYTGRALTLLPDGPGTRAIAEGELVLF